MRFKIVKPKEIAVIIIKNVDWHSKDFNEYILLNPDYVQIDDQDEIKEKIHIKKYHTMPYVNGRLVKIT